ncbi:OsmC family protein [Neorhizobium galegae]|uniref:OsmC family protein n=1 Tax=Neorhizobium galegae TaxID=399 RepID=A0A6A1TPY3_NEOGA|nr:OsmC family protein [Neorhizobium galegae]KAB1086851.1 OsmC family protein [Neorhizobium galegae]
MVELKVKTRPIGATAILGRLGHPQVTSETNGHVDVVTGASEPGFNPLDLMFSSLAACLVLSGRIAASKLGILDRLSEVKVHVTGEKAHEGPSRITKFIVDFRIEGDFDDEQKKQIAHMAEEICTVSNTLKNLPDILLASA